MEKINLFTGDIAQENAQKLAELFPDVVTEVLDEDGNLRHSIDVEALKARVGDIAEDKRERYQFTWPGKQRAKAEAVRTIDKTMRPCPEESVNWDTTENLYIEGDNLDALKILRDTYAGKIKMIYIDPPYNTGHDFIYDDDFSQTRDEYNAESGDYDEEGGRLVANPESNGRFHSDWCSMMYPRLLLARDLLSEDGVIFISIADQEVATLRKSADELYGEKNFVGQIAWESTTQPDNIGGARFRFQQKMEYILMYAKDKRVLAPFILQEKQVERSYPHDGKFGKCRLTVIERAFDGAYARPTMQFEIMGHKPRPGKQWQIGEETARRLEQEGKLECVGGTVKRAIYPEDEADEKSYVPFWSLFAAQSVGTSQKGKMQLEALLGKVGFETVKPVELIERLVSIFPNNITVLDYFAGSSTTAHAVMNANAKDCGRRHCISVQLPVRLDKASTAAKAGYKNICEIGKERIRRAGTKIAAEVEEANKQLKLGEEPKRIPDIGFRVLKIDSSNFQDVMRDPNSLSQDALLGLADNLKPDRSPMDLLFQVLPTFQIPYTAPIERMDIDGKTVFSVDDGALLACFDQNVTTEVIQQMARLEPSYAVLRDASFIGDAAMANFAEVFKTLSPATITRVV